jgi:hypothetical protein
MSQPRSGTGGLIDDLDGFSGRKFEEMETASDMTEATDPNSATDAPVASSLRMAALPRSV